MRVKIILGIIIAVLLAGLCLGGHFAKIRIDDLEAQIAEQETKIAKLIVSKKNYLTQIISQLMAY